MNRFKKEDQLQQAVCDYIKIKHPNVIFKSDLSGIKLTIGQAVKVSKSRSSAGFCDLDILEPRGIYNGLFIEFKIETPFKKDGSIKQLTRTRVVKGVKLKYNHLQEQVDMIQRLKDRGYKALFVWNYEDAICAIDKYLSL